MHPTYPVSPHVGHVRQASVHLPGWSRYPRHARNPPDRLTASGPEPITIVSVERMRARTRRAQAGACVPQMSPQASTMVISLDALGSRRPECLFFYRMRSVMFRSKCAPRWRRQRCLLLSEQPPYPAGPGYSACWRWSRRPARRRWRSRCLRHAGAGSGATALRHHVLDAAGAAPARAVNVLVLPARRPLPEPARERPKPQVASSGWQR